MSALNKTIMEALLQSLPGQVAEEMKTFIETAQNTEKQLASLADDHKLLTTELTGLRKQKGEYQITKDMKAQNELDRQANAEEKRQLALKGKDQEITYLKQAKSDMFSIMQLFVKNPRSIDIMQQHYSEYQAPYGDSHGGMIHPTNRNVDQTRITEKRETKSDIAPDGNTFPEEAL